MTVPHFDLPFRFVAGHAAQVEQDSLDDIRNCVEAVLRTFVGQRLDLLDFGIQDPTFRNQPLNLAAMADAIIEQEPRATVLLSQQPDKFNQYIADVLANVSIQEVNNA